MLSPDKPALRREYLRRRRALPASYRRDAARRALQALDPLARAASALAAYLPMGAEMDLLRRGPAHVLGSACLLADAALSPAEQGAAWRALWPALRMGIGVVLVPGVAFTAGGARLGRGGGHYDRLLAALPPNCVRVGVGFSCQLAPVLPVASHDVRMHALLTERGLSWTASGGWRYRARFVGGLPLRCVF